MSNFIFLFLSFISGLVEIGIIMMGININYDPIYIVLLGLSYQLGNLSPNPIKFGKNNLLFILVSGILFLIFYIKGNNFIFLFFSSTCLAINIQSLRSIKKDSISTSLKRTLRILGFVMAWIVTPYIMFAIFAIIGTVLLFTNFNWPKISVIKPKLNFINIIMIIHQLHYFCYSYFILLVIYKSVSNNNMFIVCCLFSIGWLTYAYVPEIIKGKNYGLYFIFGHLFLASILICLSKAQGSLACVLWLLTGFGGGTVYCINKLAIKNNSYDNNSMVFSENIGHVIGVIIGIMVFILSKKNIFIPILISGIIAILAAVLMLIYQIITYERRI